MSAIFVLLLRAALIVFAAYPGTLVASASSEAPAEALTMSVRAGFNGLVRVGAWLPVEVQIANRGTDLTADLELQVDGHEQGGEKTPAVIQSAPAVLPRFAQKRFVVDVYVPTIANKVTARLVANGNVVAQRDVPLETVPSGELLCGVLSRNSGSLQFLSTLPLAARQRGVRLAPLDLADLPMRSQTLASLDCLIFSNPASGTLSDQQRNALAGWVASGGLLIVAEGQSWQRSVSNIAAEILPVKVAGTVPLSTLDGLASFSDDPIADPGPWLASQSTVTDGTVVAAEGDHPILVGARRGNGTVYYLALDPAAEPLRSWSGSADIWRYMLSYASAAAASPAVPSRQYSGWGSVPTQALLDGARNDSPAKSGILLILLAYCMLLVPVSYFALRLGRRFGQSAAIAVLLVLSGSAATFSTAYSEREADVVLNKVTLVRAWDGFSPAVMHGYVGVLAQEQASFDLVAPPNSLVQGLTYSSYRYVTDGPGLLKVALGAAPTVSSNLLPASQLSLFAVDGELREIPVTSAITLDGSRLSGTVTNRSDQPLSSTALVVGKIVVALGDLAPGQSRAIDFDLPDQSSVGYMNNSSVADDLLMQSGVETPEDRVRQDILTAALGASYDYYARVDLNAVNFVGWMAEDPLPISVQGAKGAEYHHTLLIASLPVHLAPGVSQAIPPDLVERRPMAVNVGSKRESSEFSLAAGETDATEYTLPVTRTQFDVDYLALDVAGVLEGVAEGGAGETLGAASIFDWKRGDWVTVPLAFGTNELGEAERFVSSLGTVRVRYTYLPGGGFADWSRLTLKTFDIVVGGRRR